MYLVIPDDINVIKIPTAYWVRNLTKGVWLNSSAYNQSSNGFDARNNQWGPGDILLLGQLRDLRMLLL